ncbi:STAS domain-containing protein [Actinophytocola glycyrrhizae]|uniref:Anti-sigma factor antagonist n=1 Tax=Actinophytocola glycyrrhizae TaxID=2044873 RepID=A0ABV9SBR9_9PSEU
MTTALLHVSSDHLPLTATVPPRPRPATQPLTVTSHPAPPAATVLTVRGEVDMLTSTQLQDHLLPLVRDTVPHVIVDLTGVSFFGAAGLTVLVNACAVATAAGVTLRLVASTRPVLLPLTITGMDGVFDVSHDLVHALMRAGCGPDG